MLFIILTYRNNVPGLLLSLLRNICSNVKLNLRSDAGNCTLFSHLSGDSENSRTLVHENRKRIDTKASKPAVYDTGFQKNILLLPFIPYDEQYKIPLALSRILSFVIRAYFSNITAAFSTKRAFDMTNKICSLILTRAPLGYFYNAPHWGGGLFLAPPSDLETTGPILKIQAAFESPGKTVEGKQILLTSGSRVTSQVRSKSKCSTFRAWWHRRAKLRC